MAERLTDLRLEELREDGEHAGFIDIHKAHELFAEITALKAQLLIHQQSMSSFLNELYAIMVDPLAEGRMKVEEITAQILKAAIRDRDNDRIIGEQRGEISSLKKQLEECQGEHGLLAEIGNLRKQLEEAIEAIRAKNGIICDMKSVIVGSKSWNEFREREYIDALVAGKSLLEREG